MLFSVSVTSSTSFSVQLVQSTARGMAVMSILVFDSNRPRRPHSPAYSRASYAVVLCNDQGIVANLSGLKYHNGTAVSLVYKVGCSRR